VTPTRPPEDALFEAPIDEFTRARDALAKTLGGEEAARVKALRKPSVSAWAVNQLARRHADLIETVVKTGEDMRKAQLSADTAKMREAMTAQRRAVAAAADRAKVILEEGGHPATASTLERVSATLHAAAAGRESAGTVRAGRLTRDLEPPGFEALGGQMPAPKPGAPPKRDAAAQRRKHARLEQLEREAAEAEEQAGELGEAAETARREVARAERAAERAAEQARKARERAEAAREDLKPGT
jgi:hypothetical protein